MTNPKNDTPELFVLLDQYSGMPEEARETVRIIMADVLAAMNSDTGGGVMFIDPTGEGEMNVHLMGDMELVPHMLRTAPTLYEKVFGVPAGANVQ